MAARKRLAGKSNKPVPPRRAPTPRGVERDQPQAKISSKKAESKKSETRRKEREARLRKGEPAFELPDPLGHARRLIREIKDFPKRGILFYDITTLIADPRGLQIVIDALAQRLIGQNIDSVVAMESRGFIFGGALAVRLNAGFIPVRKPGKLPYRTDRVAYQLEYGEAELEIHRDAITPGARVVILDDLLATGGTAEATARLVEEQGGTVAVHAFVVELAFLGGRSRLAPTPVLSLIQY
jgi:adenine phosphoribosyltransferase